MNHRLTRFLLRRLLAASVAVVGVVTAVFAVQRLVPGDPVDTLLGEHASEAERHALRARLGLDRPWVEQYGRLWLDVLDGSLGMSYAPGESQTVSSVLAAHVPATVELAVAGVAVAIALALPLGLFAAFRAGSAWDDAAMAVALSGISIPNFWLGPALIYLVSVRWRLLPDPVADASHLSALVLPALVLGTALAGKLALMIRSSVIEVLGEPFVLVARARGVSPMRLVGVHVLRNAALPVLTVLGMQFASLLTGALVTEKVFARPGLGSLLLDSVAERNYPVVQGAVIVMALAYVGVNLVTDALYGIVDPRVRIAGGAAVFEGIS